MPRMKGGRTAKIPGAGGGRIPGGSGRIPGSNRPMPRSVTKGSRALRYWVNLSRVQDNIESVGTHLVGVAKKTAEELAPQMEDYMKINAPWNDATGLARDGLTARVDEEGDAFTITISHSVDYGMTLETKEGGRFAILVPTLVVFMGRVHGSLRSNA